MKKILLCNKTNKKIEPHILSPCLSNKDSLAKDRVPAQVFEKSTDHMANKKREKWIVNGHQNAKKNMTSQVSRTIHVLFSFVFLELDVRPQVYMQMIPSWENVHLLPRFSHRMKTRKCVTEANEWEKEWKWSVYFTIHLQPQLFIGSCLEMSHFLSFWSHILSK